MKTRKARSLITSIATGAVAMAFGATALADGGIPRAYTIMVEPGNAKHMLIRSQFWGLFDQRAAPDWSLYCSEAFGGKALQSVEFPTVLGLGGRILVASGFDGLYASDDGCAWRVVDAFGGNQVNAITSDDTAGKSFTAVGIVNGDKGSTSVVYRSSDRGDTWAPVKGTLEANYSLTSVAVAPSDPQRIYLSGLLINVGTAVLAKSTDGGATWVLLPIGSPDGFSPVVISGIHPTNPDVVFVRINAPEMAGTPPVPDDVWGTGDGGKTWKHAYTSTGDLPGLAISPDGKTVLLSGPTEGIKSASIDDVLAGKADAFTSTFTGMVWGLSMIDGKLYAGNDDFGGKPPFMVGVSTDLGKTFQPVMDHCEVQFPMCAMDSRMESACREQWERQGGYVTDFLQQGACAAANGGSAGAAGAAGAAGSAGSAGASGAAGSSGTAGAGGTTGMAGTGAVAGSTAAGATSPAGAGGTTGVNNSKSSSGCAVSGKSESGFVATLLVALVALGLRRRRQ